MVTPDSTIKEIIGRFVPCEVCGNSDTGRFRLRVINGASTVKCDECEEEYFTPDVDDVLQKIKEGRTENRNENIRQPGAPPPAAGL